VRMRLVSDVPLGALLSGGLDSGIVVAAMREFATGPLCTVSVGFEGGGELDETALARESARAFGTEHHEIRYGRNDALAILPELVWHNDLPIAEPLIVPSFFLFREARKHVTVVLSGEGADELFGGYRRHRLPGLLAKLQWLPPALARAGARALGERDQHRRTLAGERLVMARKLLEARGRGPFLAAYLSALEPARPSAWREATALAVDPGAVASALAAEMEREFASPPASPAALASAADHLWYLPDDLLLKEDRSTMGASLEGRVPYLDDALVRFAAALPISSRIEGATGKRILRRLAERVLPSEIATRRKHGFSVPIEDWLRGPLDALAGDTFAGRGSGLFHMDVIRRWHQEHRRHRDRSGALWAALCFELWWREVATADTARLIERGRPLRPSRLGPAAGARA